jgi:ketol-acid reductoisomerase
MANAFELLVEKGCDPDSILVDFYLSGELEEVARAIREAGLFEQIDWHSPTSRYGQLSRSSRLVSSAVRAEVKAILEEIEDGRFAREWATEQAEGVPHYTELRRYASQHALTLAERKWRARQTATSRAEA